MIINLNPAKSSNLEYSIQPFKIVSALLRLSTQFQVHRLRNEVIRGLSNAWPSTLAQWEIREANATDSLGIYCPRLTIPHPMYVRRTCFGLLILTVSSEKLDHQPRSIDQRARIVTLCFL